MTFISTLGQSQDQIIRLKNLQLGMADLQLQLTTGKKTQSFKGLETDVITSKRARADFKKTDSFLQNIQRGQTRIDLMVNGIKTIQTQANNIIDSIVKQTQEGDVELDFIRRLADNAFDFIVDTLNLKDGDAFVFAGSDASSQPIIDTGALDAFFGDLNAQWSAGTLTINPPNTTIYEEYISRYKNISQVTLGYSGSLSNAKQVFVRADDNVEINYTVTANSDPFRDIIASVMALKNIAELDIAPGASEDIRQENFFAVFNDLALTLTNAVDALDNERFKLNTAQAQLADIKSQHTRDREVLLNTVSRVEDADMNEVAVKINALSTQIEASYQVTALVSQLTLVNFL